MARLGRLAAVALLTLGTLVTVSAPASSDHCPPIDNPDPIPGQNTTYCHTPRPSDTPEPADTPEPTDAPPTRVPTAAPTRAPIPGPQRTQPPIVRSTPESESTPFDLVEVPEENALETPEIVVDGPLEGDTNFEVAEPTASVSSWIFGFIFGFIIGGLVGRASWGLRRKRRQQIFG